MKYEGAARPAFDELIGRKKNWRVRWTNLRSGTLSQEKSKELIALVRNDN